MSTIDLETLENVTGGVVVSRSSTSDAINQSLSTIQSSLTALTSNNNNNSSSNLLLPMAMMMAMNRRQTVIAGGGGTFIG